MQPLSPFSLRLQLITLAKDMLMDQYHTERERLLEQWRLDVDVARTHNTQNTLPPIPKFPDYPTEQDILKKANTLNEFVSKNK